MDHREYGDNAAVLKILSDARVALQGNGVLHSVGHAATLIPFGIAGFALFLGLGYLVDRWLGTQPVFMIVIRLVTATGFASLR